jgi:hypothetical protein
VVSVVPCLSLAPMCPPTAALTGGTPSLPDPGITETRYRVDPRHASVALETWLKFARIAHGPLTGQVSSLEPFHNMQIFDTVLQRNRETKLLPPA